MSNRFAPLNPQIYYENQGSGIDALALCLQGGALSLFLGAGVSADFKLCDWKTLTDRCLKDVGREGLDPSRQYTGADLARKLDNFVMACEQSQRSYRQIVHDQLYGTGDPFTIERMFGSRLLASLAALLMGSRFGCVRQVVTTNYDNVLERYLNFHGFKTQAVVSPHQTLEDADSVLYHPHGYLPYKQTAQFSESLVLSNTSYNLFLADDGWKHVVMRMMCTSVPLIIGSSGNDPIIDYYLDVIRHNEHLDRNTLGFICVGPSSGVERDTIDRLLARKLVPIHFESWDRLPEVLFTVCRKARGIPA